MPFTPYHFGPSGFVGLVFKKYIDLPAFVLANVIVDFEVLFGGWPYPHRVWHFHTFLGGAVIGAILGLVLYPAREFFEWFLGLLHLDYKSNIYKIVISGALGACFHVFIDGIYHWDVQIFWPNQSARPLWKLLSQTHVKQLCIAFWIAAVVLYMIMLYISLRKKKRL